MKDATREGLHVKNKKEEKESVTEEEEELFWNLNQYQSISISSKRISYLRIVVNVRYCIVSMSCVNYQ